MYIDIGAIIVAYSTEQIPNSYNKRLKSAFGDPSPYLSCSEITFTIV